jgi:heptosyltransferase-3
MTPSREARRVLVINVARIGDTLLATPALHAIHTACNDGKLTVLAHPSRLELLRHLPFIQQLAPITKTRASWMTYFALRQRYDWAFVY